MKLKIALWEEIEKAVRNKFLITNVSFFKLELKCYLFNVDSNFEIIFQKPF